MKFEMYDGSNGLKIIGCEEHGDRLKVFKEQPLQYFGICTRCGKEYKLDLRKAEEQFNV